MKLNINTDAAVVFTNKLEKMSKSTLPYAIRTALNNAAFDVKQKTLPKSAKDNFVNRQPNFFKANSSVDMAKGSNIKTMKATIGMISTKLNGGNNHAVTDLEEQEHGGRIKGKSFIPMDKARTAGRTSSVRKGNRITGVKNLVKQKNAQGKNEGQKFYKSVAFAGKGGYVLGTYKGKQIVWRVNSLKRTKKGKAKLTEIYSYKNDRSVKVRGTHFMREASLKSAKKIESHFIETAKRLIK